MKSDSFQTVGQLHLGLLVNCIRPGMLSSTMPPSSRGSNGEHRDEVSALSDGGE